MDVDDGTVCAAGASFLYAGGAYPFSNVARCSAQMAADCQRGSCAANVAVGDGGVVQPADTVSSDDGCEQERDINAVDWEAENVRLLRELHAVTQQRDAALVLAKQLHNQIASGSAIVGMLSRDV
jgi:hypothetical protein